MQREIRMSKVVSIGQMMGHGWLGVVWVKVNVRPAKHL